MKKGQKMVASDGYQVCLYPLADMNLNQLWGANSFSHCCGKPIDDSHATGTELYAPCDCTRVATLDYANGYSAFFWSDRPVHTPTGLKRVCFSFTHANSLLSKTSYKQGDVIYTCGTSGGVIGPHVHIECSFTKCTNYIFSGVYCQYGNPCYMMEGSTSPVNMFYINDTKITSSLGLTFKKFTGTTGSLKWVIPTSQANRFLNEGDKQNNAQIIYNYFASRGWTRNAICGLLGNMEQESTINPNCWQDGAEGNLNLGFGLVQWTGAGKILDYFREKGVYGQIQKYGDYELQRLMDELNGIYQAWIPTTKYPVSFKDFSTSTEDYKWCTECFMLNYERPGTPELQKRYDYAKKWWDFFDGWSGPGLLPHEPHKRKKMPLWMYIRRR